jgi:hypothetical protein
LTFQVVIFIDSSLARGGWGALSMCKTASADGHSDAGDANIPTRAIFPGEQRTVASAIDTCSAVVACAQRWCWCICSSLLSHSAAWPPAAGVGFDLLLLLFVAADLPERVTCPSGGDRSRHFRQRLLVLLDWK